MRKHYYSAVVNFTGFENMRHIAVFIIAFMLVSCAPNASDENISGGEQPFNAGQPYVEDSYELTSTDHAGALFEESSKDLVEGVKDRVFFSFNSARLSAHGQRTIMRQAQWLQKYPEMQVIIEGHADERGTREYNLAIGEKRANTVKQTLISYGVAASRISTVSYGKEHPEDSRSNEVAWSKNRRAVTVISK